jgi:dienelactone hydrolase
MKLVTAVIIGGLVAALADPISKDGPFGPAGRTQFDIPTLLMGSPTGQRVYAWYPDNVESPPEGGWPVLIYGHGMTGGGTNLETTYPQTWEVASYGFIVLAPATCQSTTLIPLYCPDFYLDIYETYRYARETGAALDPILAYADFESPVGAFGNSMGGHGVTAMAATYGNNTDGIAFSAIIVQEGSQPPDICAAWPTNVPVQMQYGTLDPLTVTSGKPCLADISPSVSSIFANMFNSSHGEFRSPGRYSPYVSMYFRCLSKWKDWQACEAIYGTKSEYGQSLCFGHLMEDCFFDGSCPFGSYDDCLSQCPSGVESQLQCEVTCSGIC